MRFSSAEAKSSSVYAHSEYISGSLDWVCKETVCRKKRARDEAPGMSGAWDWALKETPRATSAARFEEGFHHFFFLQKNQTVKE
jgi:hypothetical protein